MQKKRKFWNSFGMKKRIVDIVRHAKWQRICYDLEDMDCSNWRGKGERGKRARARETA